MSHSGSIITAPIQMQSDLASVLGIPGTDLAESCKSSAINMWAKYKPVRTPVMDTITGQWDSANNRWLSSAHWWKNTQAGSATQGGTPTGSCGLHIEYFRDFGSIGSSQTFAYKLANGLLGWTYEKPVGGSQSPYRLQDFAQYFHGAIQPYGDLGTNEYHLDINNKVTFQWDLPVSEYPELNLALSDFSVAGTSLRSFHLGVFLWDGTITRVYISQNTFGSGDINVETDSDQSLAQKGTARQRTWSMMPFFSLGTDPNQTGIFLSMANATPEQVTIMMHGTVFCQVMAEFNQAGNTISFTIDAINQTSSTHTDAQVYVEIKKIPDDSPIKPEAWDGDVYHHTFTRTLTAQATTTITGSVSMNYERGYIYWIMSRVMGVGQSTSGYEQVDADIFVP